MHERASAEQGGTSQNTTAGSDASGRGFDSSCDHRARGDMAPRRGRTRRVLVGPPSHGLRLVRQRVSSGQAGFDVHGLGQGRHSHRHLGRDHGALRSFAPARSSPGPPRTRLASASFRRESTRPRGPIEQDLGAKFLRCPGASPPRSFGRVWTGREKAPAFPGSYSAGTRSEPRCTGRKRVPTMGQLGRCGLRSTDHRGWSLPILAGRSPAEVRPPGLSFDAEPGPMLMALRGARAPYYECQYYGSSTYKIVSGIDFRFGQNGVFGRIYL
jgi:hypothetical protein